jgi:uncharacterized membrane protein (DUF4010 family)
MPAELLPMLPRDALNIALVLALAFFVGLEREEDQQRQAKYAFGGVRVFPLVGLVSYALALISAPEQVAWTIGFAVVGGFMLLSYYHRLKSDPHTHLTSEISALAVYAIGGLVQHEYYWIATTIGVLSVLLLELKKGLEGLTKHVASIEIITVAKFLLVSVVILPVVPDQEFTRYHLDPFKIWLMVVAVSGISFASYVIQRVLKSRGGVVTSAILGGAYSSTVATIVLARQARHVERPNLYAGAILTAASVMYARLVLLLALFNPALALELAPVFGTLAVIGALAGWGASRSGSAGAASAPQLHETKNPLALGAAFLFALVFVVISVLTSVAKTHLGQPGLYALAAIMGVADVDPFTLAVAQGTQITAPLHVAACAMLIAPASNNVAKAVYAYSLADRVTGRRSMAMLLAFAALGIIPLAWM